MRKRELYIKKYQLRMAIGWIVFILAIISTIRFLTFLRYGVDSARFMQQFPIFIINAIGINTWRHITLGAIIYAAIIGLLIANMITVIRVKKSTLSVVISVIDIAYLIYMAMVPIEIFNLVFIAILAVFVAVFVKVLGDRTIPKGGFKKGEIEKYERKTDRTEKKAKAKRAKKSGGDEEEI